VDPIAERGAAGEPLGPAGERAHQDQRSHLRSSARLRSRRRAPPLTSRLEEPAPGDHAVGTARQPGQDLLHSVDLTPHWGAKSAMHRGCGRSDTPWPRLL
jgi:hypothetical protein